MKISKRQLRRIIKEEKATLLKEQAEVLDALPGPPDPRLAQAVDLLEDIMEDLRMQGAQRDPSEKRDIYRHKKTRTYGGPEAVRRAEEAEQNAQYTYDDLKPLMELLLSVQKDA
jgi:hypothetical protein